MGRDSTLEGLDPSPRRQVLALLDCLSDLASFSEHVNHCFHVLLGNRHEWGPVTLPKSLGKKTMQIFK